MLSLPIPTDPDVIRSFIMHDVLLGKPVFKGYKDLCKIIPEFDYPEYDFWYYRFLAGNPDLNYDRSADPKPKKLEELPVYTLSKILENVDAKHRFKSQKLSKTMMFAVDQLKTAYDKIDITYYHNSVSVYVKDGFSWWGLQYSSMPNGCEVQRMHRGRTEEIVGGDFMEIALHDLGNILRPTKIRLEKFEICAYDSKDSRRIADLLVSKKANSEFHVKSAEIKIRESNLALTVLSVTKPGVLEKLEIGISCKDEPELIDMNQIKDMEQFKQAKTVNLTKFGFLQSTDLAFFLGFETFTVCVNSMEPEDVIRLRDDLSKPDNTTFKSCSIKLEIPLTNLVKIARFFGKDVPKKRIRVECSIANSEKVLRFFIRKDKIDIVKTDPDHYYLSSDYSYSDSSDSRSDYDYDSDAEIHGYDGYW